MPAERSKEAQLVPGHRAQKDTSEVARERAEGNMCPCVSRHILSPCKSCVMFMNYSVSLGISNGERT